jgi:hypothetical protein
LQQGPDRRVFEPVVTIRFVFTCKINFVLTDLPDPISQ